MKHMWSRISILMVLGFCQLSIHAQLYFPPLAGAQWESTDPKALGWCTEAIDPFYQFLDQEESKAVIVLKDGKIVLEKYFDTFTRDSLWYWASAGKTLTAFLIGVAKEEGLLDLQASSSKYLGKGWTQCSELQENKITIWHQLSMTTGLEDGVPDNHCTLPSCLSFKADPGSRWAYHNAPYTLLRNVLQAASGVNENSFIQQKLKSRTGIKGLWFTSGYDNVYASDARSMARFGLLMLNHGVWNRDSILKDQSYLQSMISPSQSLNPSYGYLWWLNGQSSFKLPGLQIDFKGSLVPQAPKDMYAGIGKNGQLLFVVPSQNLVALRMGEANGNDEVPITLARDLWELLNKIICNQPVKNEDLGEPTYTYRLQNNPVADLLEIPGLPEGTPVRIFNAFGKCVLNTKYFNNILLSDIQSGIYYINITYNNLSIPFIKI